MARSNFRTCPVCGYTENADTPPGQQISAVFNGRRRTPDGVADDGRCMCPVCRSMWDELVFSDGHRVNLVVQRGGGVHE